MTHLNKGRVAVIGAGLAGSSTALAIAQEGVDVLLVEQDAVPMNRASRRNEGKIHLGFVYANEPSMVTARLMLEGALRFAPLLRDWVGKPFSEVAVSTPFVYLVAKDSIMSADALADFYERLDAAYVDLISCGGDYLGRRPQRLFRPMDDGEWRKTFSSEKVAVAFRTEELAVDPGGLARAVRLALSNSDKITLMTDHRVDHVSRSPSGFAICGENPNGAFTIDVDQVVNATWERRPALDRQLGIEPEGSLLHRLKFRVIGSLPAIMNGGHSSTIVLGPYGDVVVRPGNTVFLSWYPSCLRGWTHGLEPPREWDAACKGEVEANVRRSVVDDTVANLDEWYPGISGIQPLLVDAGAIVAHGFTDVHDPASQLHRRDRVGVVSVDGYHSLDPGKLTTAPLFAERAAAHVLESAGVPSLL